MAGMGSSISAALLATALALAGCNSGRDWSGDYKGQLNPPAVHENPDIVLTLSAIKLSVMQGRFSLFLRGMAYEGNVGTGMDEANLQVDRVAGRPPVTETAPLRLKWKSGDTYELIEADGTVHALSRIATGGVERP